MTSTLTAQRAILLVIGSVVGTVVGFGTIAALVVTLAHP